MDKTYRKIRSVANIILQNFLTLKITISYLALNLFDNNLSQLQITISFKCVTHPFDRQKGVINMPVLTTT